MLNIGPITVNTGVIAAINGFHDRPSSPAR